MHTLIAPGLCLIGLFVGWHIARARAAWRMRKAAALAMQVGRISIPTELSKAGMLIGALTVLVLIWVLL